MGSIATYSHHFNLFNPSTLQPFNSFNPSTLQPLQPFNPSTSSTSSTSSTLQPSPMQSDPIAPQGRKTIKIGEFTLLIETPPDLDQLLIKAAENTPGEVDSIPYYSILWPSATALTEHLYKNRDLIKGKRVIELGCGLGLPSILCAKLGADVIATDFHPDNEQWLNHNAALNQVELSYLQLNWNLFVCAAPETFITPAPLIIGSDLIYESKHIAALVCTLNTLCAPKGKVVIADPGRDNLSIFVTAMEKSGWRHTLETENDMFVLHFERERRRRRVGNVCGSVCDAESKVKNVKVKNLICDGFRLRRGEILLCKPLGVATNYTKAHWRNFILSTIIEERPDDKEGGKL